MSNYNSLKTTIDANIKQNGRREITGQILNSVLNAMVNTLGAGYQFAGVAVSDTDPGTPDAKVFYIANGKGTYEKFGGINVTEDEVVVLYYDTEWHKVATGIASNSKLTAMLNDIDNVKTDIDNVKTDVDNVKDVVNASLAGKQDTIADLDAIRQGAQKGSTALQSESDPIYLADKPKLALKVEIPDVSGKVDKVVGKGLSSNDYTDADKLKLTGLENYDDTQVRALIADKQDKLVPGDNITIVGNVISSTGGGGGEGGGGSVDLSSYAKKVEVESALEGKQDTITDLDAIREGARKGSTALQEHQDISKLATKEEVATKQDKISDLATIRSGAAKGATALQSYTETDPVYMADKPSLALKSEIPDISGKADKSELSSVATSGSYDDLINKPTIPSKTSELTNDSSYLNSIPEEYVTETELDSKGYLTEHQDISGKADKATTLAGYGIGDAYTKEEVEARIASKQDLVDYVNHNSTDTGSAESPLSLIPNVLHQWTDAVSQLYLSFATPSDVTVDEFMVQFTASGSGCTLSLPDTVSWLGGSVPTITAGKTYQISIINNLAVIGEF